MENDKQIQLLEGILKWARVGALPAVTEHVAPHLDTDAKKRVYHAIAEGTRNPRSIEEVASVSRETAQKLVAEWSEAGLVVAGSNPPKAVFTLAELNIPAPTLKEPRPRKPGKR